MVLGLAFCRFPKPYPNPPLRALPEKTQKCTHNHVPLSGIGAGRWSGALCGSSIYEHSQESQNPNRRQLDHAEMAPLFIKQTHGELQASQGSGHQERSVDQVRHVPPTGAGSQVRHHFFAQTHQGKLLPEGKY